MLIILIAVLAYLFVACGVLRWELPRQYEVLRTPRNGVQMDEDDARRETVKLSLQTAFCWPLLLSAFALLAPMVLVFDGIPAAAKATGRGAMAVGRATAPALAPVTTWATKPLDAAINRDRQLALSARADEPIADTPLVPDEIATWTPPAQSGGEYARSVSRADQRYVYTGSDPFDDPLVIVEHFRQAKRVRREEA